MGREERPQRAQARHPRHLDDASSYFDDVHVPAANVLGEVGRGFKVAMEVLNSGRLGLASGLRGRVRSGSSSMAVERVQERKAFGRPIGEFGLIKDKIAAMMAETYALESMTYLTTGHRRRARRSTTRSRARSAKCSARRRSGAS